MVHTVRGHESFDSDAHLENQGGQDVFGYEVAKEAILSWAKRGAFMLLLAGGPVAAQENSGTVLVADASDTGAYSLVEPGGSESIPVGNLTTLPSEIRITNTAGEELNPTDYGISIQTAVAFMQAFDTLNPAVRQDFGARFQNLSIPDMVTTLRIFQTSYQGLPQTERGGVGQLLRGSIMISDIHENVRYVAETGDIREIDGRMEGTGILRFVERVVQEYPQSREVITDAYLDTLRADYEAAALAIEERGARAREISAELRASTAEARATSAEARATSAEARATSAEARASAERDAEFVRQLRIEMQRIDGFTQQLRTLELAQNQN